MELIQAIHQNNEADWMGVFHASAVGNSKKTVLFLGDSGNGKSTSLAILQANGFACIADDFVPIDVKKQEVYSFPAAISIKKNSLKTLLPIYPELATTAEYKVEHTLPMDAFLLIMCLLGPMQHFLTTNIHHRKTHNNGKLSSLKTTPLLAVGRPSSRVVQSGTQACLAQVQH